MSITLAPPKAAVRRIPSLRLPAAIRYWLVITFLMLGFCGASAAMLAELRRDSWRLADKGAQSLLAVLSQAIESDIRAYDRVLTTVAAKLANPDVDSMEPRLQQAFLFDGALISPDLAGLFVLDGAGNVVREAGVAQPRPDDLAGGPAFAAHAKVGARGLFISAPFRSGRTGKDAVVALGRRVDAPDGSFAGVVVGTLRLGSFKAIFEEAHLHPHDAINLFSSDGILLMRSPYEADQIGRDLSGSDNLRRFRSAPSGSFSGVSDFDGVTRLYNFTRVGDLPLILNVALSHDDILAAWRGQAMRIALVLAILCALTTTLGLVLRREFRRRARAEKVTRESEMQYRLLADHATDVILRLDEDMTRRYVSPAAQTMLGFAPAELVGRKTREIIHPDDWPLVETIVREARSSRLPAEAIYRIRHRSGRYVWVEGRYSFVSEDGGFIVVLRDISRRKSAEAKLAAAHAELARRADTDGLTGLANRRRLDETLEAEFAGATEPPTPVSLLLIDVDRFKQFNDTQGHQAGDDCLRRVAQAIENCVRPGDLCARYGGEEIAVVLPATEGPMAHAVAERIRGAVRQLAIPHPASEKGSVTVSIGCATHEKRADETAATLVGCADRLLYEAKRTGRDKVLSMDALDAGPPPLPADEPARLEAVKACRERIGEDASRNLDMIARNAARLLDAPIGFVSLVGADEVTLVGKHGVGGGSFPRDHVFCSHTIAGGEPLVVPDALADGRFNASPLVRGEGGLRFYAGAPLVDRSSGMTIGAVCVAGNVPRPNVSPCDRTVLENLSRLASAELDAAPASSAASSADA